MCNEVHLRATESAKLEKALRLRYVLMRKTKEKE